MIRVMLVDDQNLVRKGVRSLLELSEEIEVIAEASDGAEAIRTIPEVAPDVVLLDMRMPGLSGLDVLKALSEAETLPPTIILTTFDDDELVLAGIKCGARGYLLKDSAFDELALSIRRVIQGEVFLGTGITGLVVDQLMSDRSKRKRALTQRETEVLQLLASGKSTADIAQALELSVKTVETHRRQVMHKLELHSVAELTKYAIRSGLTSVDS